MSFTTADIRNIALVGHGGTGKTSLLEQMLFNAGVIQKAEHVSTGRTVSDYTEEEIEKKMSIHSTLTNLTWDNKKINIFDTPGASDFIGEVVSSFRASEAAVVVVGARAAVQIETIKLWRRLDTRSMPRFIFINKMDVERASFETTLEDLKDRFEANFVPITIPMGDGENFTGIIDLVAMKAYMAGDGSAKEEAVDIPAEYKDAAEEARANLIEAAAEGDDELMEKFFDEGTLSNEDLLKGLNEAIIAGACRPVLCGAAEKGVGIRTMLDSICIAAPSPASISETLVNESGEQKELQISSNGDTTAFVFKTSIDQFSGKLSYVKVVTGSITPDKDLTNVQMSKKERLSKIYFCEGKNLADTKEIIAGDIGIIAKMESVETNATLALSPDEFTFTILKLPQPVHALSIEAESKKDEDKLNQFLHRAAEEDLTFQLNYNQETKETVISGMGELHINMILDRIKDNQKINMLTHVPKVAYRETITKSADAEYTHKKQSGGHGQYGRVVLEIKPLQRGEQFSFENAIKGGSISKGYMPGIEKGLIEAMNEGFLAGYPIVDVGCRVVDGKEHPVDSSEMAFKLAGKGAMRACFEKAGVQLLEPVMNLKVFSDEQYIGDILSDLSSRRGRVQGQEPIGGGITEVDAQVPQAELLRYSIDLRSITSGTASFEMEFDHYSTISGKIADAVIAESKKDDE